MSDKITHVGFIGGGGIERAHAFALNSPGYYNNNSPETKLEVVTSSGEASR